MAGLGNALSFGDRRERLRRKTPRFCDLYPWTDSGMLVKDKCSGERLGLKVIIEFGEVLKISFEMSRWTLGTLWDGAQGKGSGRMDDSPSQGVVKEEGLTGKEAGVEPEEGLG